MKILSLLGGWASRIKFDEAFTWYWVKGKKEGENGLLYEFDNDVK